MELRRIGKIDVHAKVNGNDSLRTGFVFYSYARGSSALEFHFKDQQGKPVDMLGTKVRLLLIVKVEGEEKEFKTLDEEIVTESSLNGIVRYIIPDRLMGYQGIVDGWIYLDFPDGSKTDEVRFRFTMARSKIDEEVPLIQEFYVPQFEEMLESVKTDLNADVALAKSKINQSVTETQNVAQVEQGKIQEELPKIQTELSEMNTEVAEAKVKVDELKAGLKLYTAYKMADGRFTNAMPNTNKFIKANNMTPNSYNGSTVVIERGISVPEWGATDAIRVTISGGTHASIVGTIHTGLSTLPSGSVTDFDTSIYVKNIGSAPMNINPQFGSRSTVLSNEAKYLTWFAKGFSAPSVLAQQFVLTRAAQSDTVDIILWRPKWANLDKTEDSTIFTTNPSEDLLNANPKQKGLGILNSESESDYIWQYSDDYIDYLFGLKADKTELNALADRVSILE